MSEEIEGLGAVNTSVRFDNISAAWMHWTKVSSTSNVSTYVKSYLIFHLHIIYLSMHANPHTGVRSMPCVHGKLRERNSRLFAGQWFGSHKDIEHKALLGKGNVKNRLGRFHGGRSVVVESLSNTRHDGVEDTH